MNKVADAWFPIEWSPGDGLYDGKAPDDPTTVYVLPEDDEDSVWSFQLSDLVKDMVELHEHGCGGFIDEETVPIFEQVRDSLRSLANQIDSALARTKS